MSMAHEFEGCNVLAAPPPGLEEMVGNLAIFFNGRAVVSAWKPSPELLAELNAGGSIFVSVMSGCTEDGRPAIYPMFVGSESECLDVVSDTGHVWK